jgi:hypothetical protein
MRWLIGVVFTSFGLIPAATDSPVELQNSFKNHVDATDDQQRVPMLTSTSVVDGPEIDSGLFVTAVDANTIEISLPDDIPETSEDSQQD